MIARSTSSSGPPVGGLAAAAAGARTALRRSVAVDARITFRFATTARLYRSVATGREDAARIEQLLDRLLQRRRLGHVRDRRPVRRVSGGGDAGEQVRDLRVGGLHAGGLAAVERH